MSKQIFSPIFAKMKFVAILFATYLLGLNFLPCNDLFPSAEQETQNAQLSVDQSHSHTDTCSPFCQCHCCHVHVVEIDGVNFSVRKPEIHKPIFHHLDNSGWELPKNFLQPPRV